MIVLKIAIFMIILELLILVAVTISCIIDKRKNIKKTKALLADCINPNFDRHTIGVLELKFRELENYIEICRYVSYEELGISRKWIEEKIHDIHVIKAKRALEILKENLIIDNYYEFKCCVNKGVPYSELKITRKYVANLKRKAQINQERSQLEDINRQRELILEELAEEGITEEDIKEFYNKK